MSHSDRKMRLKVRKKPLYSYSKPKMAYFSSCNKGLFKKGTVITEAS